MKRYGLLITAAVAAALAGSPARANPRNALDA